MVIGIEIAEVKTKFEFNAVQLVREVDNGLEVTLIGGVTFLWPDMTYEQWLSLEKKLAYQVKLAQAK